jgi:hypothetical protein
VRAATTARREADVASVTVRKRPVFMFFETNQICSDRRQSRVRPQEKQRLEFRVIRCAFEQATKTSSNSKNSIFAHHSRSSHHPRCDRVREFDDERQTTSSHRTASYDAETPVHDSQSCDEETSRTNRSGERVSVSRVTTNVTIVFFLKKYQRKLCSVHEIPNS